MPAGKALLIEADAPFRLHYGFDGDTAGLDVQSTVGPFGMHAVRFAPGALDNRKQLDFTLQEKDYSIALG
jgi:hypothetical protein